MVSVLQFSPEAADPNRNIHKGSDLPDPPPLTIWECGYPEWERKLQLASRTLSVVTGHPGHGKTTLTMQIWANIAKRHGIKVGVASFETRAKPHHLRNVRQFYAGRLERDMSPQIRTEADEFADEHFRWIEHPEQQPSLQWLLDTFELAYYYHGCRAFIIDPWNRLESTREHGVSETEHIGQCLSAMYRFKERMDVHLMVLAHPAKVDSMRRGTAPLLEDIAGSKHWDNRPDHGLVVHRPKVVDDQGVRQTECLLLVRKARFEELGYPCQLAMKYDLDTGCYRSVDYSSWE